MTSRSVESHFDHVAADYDRWKERAAYYYENLKSLVGEVVPRHSSVCEVGCGTGDILSFLQPAEGMGLDISPEMVNLAARKHPDLTFAVHDITSHPWPERYDYVVAVDVAEHVTNLVMSTRNMAAMLRPGGMLVLTTANPLWAFWLHLAERLHLKMPEGDHHWRSAADLMNAGASAGLAVVSFDRSFVIPKRVPLIHRLNTSARGHRLRQRFGLIQRIVLRDGGDK